MQFLWARHKKAPEPRGEIPVPVIFLDFLRGRRPRGQCLLLDFAYKITELLVVRILIERAVVI